MGGCSMRSAIAIVSVCLSVATAVSCAEPAAIEVDRLDVRDELVRAFCERQQSCDCEYRSYDTLVDCIGAVDVATLDLDRQLAVVGVVYDAACAGELVHALDERACGGWEPAGLECEQPCKLAHGSAGLGESCEEDFECDQGLVCAYDENELEYHTICIDPCAPSQRPNCNTVRCDDGLFCDWENSRCVVPPGDGESCFQGNCAEGTFCRFDPVAQDNLCVAPGAYNDPCMGHSECASGYCPAGFCKSPPQRGEICEAGACADGLWCNPTSTRCETAPPPVPAICEEGPSWW